MYSFSTILIYHKYLSSKCNINFPPLGNTQGLGQNDGSLYDEHSFLSTSIVIPKVNLKASVRKQKSCSKTKSKCIYINNLNRFLKNKAYFVDFDQRTQKRFIQDLEILLLD